jgi:hypothetical protein
LLDERHRINEPSACCESRSLHIQDRRMWSGNLPNLAREVGS